MFHWNSYYWKNQIIAQAFRSRKSEKLIHLILPTHLAWSKKKSFILKLLFFVSYLSYVYRLLAFGLNAVGNYSEKVNTSTAWDSQIPLLTVYIRTSI